MSKINKAWVDATVLTEDLYDQPNGVPQLDGTGKLPASSLPTEVVEFKGAWDALTNSPTLIDGTGDTGDLYRVSVAGTQDLGSGAVTYAIGDQIIYNGTIWQRIPADSSFIGKTTSDLAEGTNLYFTEPRVLASVLAGFVAGPNSPVLDTDSVLQGLQKLQSQITNIPSVSVAASEEVITLNATDISNGFYDLAGVPATNSLTVFPDNGPVQVVNADYTIIGNRVTFLGDLQSTLVDGSVIIFKYFTIS